MSDRIHQLLQLLQTNQNDAFCLYGLAMEHAKLGQHRQAVQWFDRSIEADPHSSYAYFHKARSLEALNEVTAARETLQQGLEQARNTNDPKAAGEIAGYLDLLE